MNADIHWLQSNWQLPEKSSPLVESLLKAEAAGSTAIELAAWRPADWGKAAALVTDPAQPPPTPLCAIHHDGHIYLQSHLCLRAEWAIATAILSRAAARPVTPADLDGRIAELFPNAGPQDRQLAATRMALTRSISWITGGPGTGKTYTLARILALLAASGTPPDQIRLAAPTGKAAQRMKAAVQDSLASLPPNHAGLVADLSACAAQATTLHRLIGWNPASGDCRGSAAAPNGVVIVDECSMIDLHLWRALFDALPTSARIILLGDPNQLESVGQGNVFGCLARAASRAPFDQLHIQLTEARRFRDRPAILHLAHAIERADAEGVAALLEHSRDPAAPQGLAWIDAQPGRLAVDRLPASTQQALLEVACAADPMAALQALQRICILTPYRDELSGAMGISRSIQQFLTRRGINPFQPIIIQHNDPETGLHNGSIGVIHPAGTAPRMASFLDGDGRLRTLPCHRLPEHAPAWAITIHRSQGSEYDEVVVLAPRANSPLATRELLYTAITRARSCVRIIADLPTVCAAVATPSTRFSLLDRVWLPLVSSAQAGSAYPAVDRTTCGKPG